MNNGALPASVRELVDVLGMETTTKLVRALGGTTFPIPKRETRQGEIRFTVLADAVGEEAAEKLVYQYGGSELYIPRCAKALQEARDAEINRRFVEECRAGKSSTDIVNELARMYKLTDRRVWDILKMNAQVSCQLSLV